MTTEEALCAAAPDLLKALKLLLMDYIAVWNSGDGELYDPELQRAVIRAREAIAKAVPNG